MSKAIKEQVSRFSEIVDGMKSNFSLLQGKGIDQAQLNKLKEDLAVIDKQNEEIDKIKAEVKERSRALTMNLLRAKTDIKEAKKVVKQNFDNSQWQKFGILDKR